MLTGGKMVTPLRFLCFAALFPFVVHAQEIRGVVSSPNGPEAGVWVIAETTDLPTKYAKVVVTDDKGRYLIPQLPKANYQVWVRGNGLVDSPKVSATPGKTVNLKARAAPSEKEAAQYYPGMYWYTMLNVPAKDQYRSRAASARLLHQAGGRAHRRPEGRLERQGAVDDVGHAHRVPQRGRHGEQPEGLQAAGAARPAREVAGEMSARPSRL
jgi:hypothetical protein